MDSEQPPDRPDLTKEWAAQSENLSTRERVYAVAIQLHVPTRVRTVAERADVSPETAREYLRWFAEIGLVTLEAESPDLFRRNEAYFEWRRVQRLRAKPAEELRRELASLTDRERDYQEQFDADAPDDVDALEHADYADLETVWEDLQEWRTVRRRIHELEQARQSRESDGNAPASA
ncbi:DUF7342 family protein [Natrarchaeobaculum aegyptiacum]|uniref:DUF7342 family protein n=1 Tax=Natrarchaeobaculum aegyptiacum TaxID=745377 RepID=UPI001E2C3201|nr:ArsR family transcriptional regulator [Natrarchaeobaculum aegyptiacum]